jgi:hypothetical protein
MRPITLLSLASLFVIPSYAQSAPEVDSNVVLHVSIATDRHEFHVGEAIPLQLSFSSAVTDRYEVNMARYDRSGRMDYEHFSVSPETGAVDPLANYPGGLGGGLTSFQFLTLTPWTITLYLNEWVRFTRSGVYRLTLTSDRVHVRDPENPTGARPVTARSNVITLKIIRSTPAWQDHIFAKTRAVLDQSPPTRPQDLEQYTNSRREALETLRFLGTPEATRELATRMRGERSDGLDFICMLGLISSPEREAARAALAEALADPDHPISSDFISTLRTIHSESDDSGEHPPGNDQHALEALIAALPTKRGKALAVSLATAVNEAWNGAPLSKQTTEELVQQLISMFDLLSQEDQTMLLSAHWDKVAGPAMLPIVRRYAQVYRDFPDMHAADAYESLQLSAWALRRWYDLDPSGARSAVIGEITRPRPRYDARVLGILPDATLPEADSALAQHFVATDDFEGSAHLASLIARYATDAILPQVLEKSDPLIGQSACDIQNPILAYVLRVSPALARPRLEDAIAARGKDFSGCNRELFQVVSNIHYDPLLETLGIHSLEDPDPQVAETAATMLGTFGSAAAESALWKRYTSWSAEWAGRESELNIMFSDQGSGDRIHELGLGQNLVQALATGRSWLLDLNKLQRLSQLTQVKRLREQLDRWIESWEGAPLTIAFSHSSAPFRFESRLAQYELHSMDALKAKTSQFPPGTHFFLSTPPSEANDEILQELRAFLTSKGLVVAGVKRSDY